MAPIIHFLGGRQGLGSCNSSATPYLYGINSFKSGIQVRLDIAKAWDDRLWTGISVEAEISFIESKSSVAIIVSCFEGETNPYFNPLVPAVTDVTEVVTFTSREDDCEFGFRQLKVTYNLDNPYVSFVTEEQVIE